MSTVDTVCTVMSGMSKDEVKAVVDHGLKLLGGNPAAARAKTKGGFSRRSGVKLKIAPTIKANATNMYGVEGEWVDSKRLKSGGYANGEWVFGSYNIGGDRGYVAGQIKSGASATVLGENVENVVLTQFDNFYEASRHYLQA